MHRFLAILLPFLIGFAISPANATDLSGKLSLSKKFIEQLVDAEASDDNSKARGYWNDPNGVKPVSPPRIDLSSDFGVALFKDDGGEPKPDPVTSVKVRTGSLEKSVIVIRPKSRIKFIMKSPFDHELYAPHKHDFKPQVQGSNSFRPIDFYSAGIFEVKCKLFPHFQGWVVVVPASHVIDVSSSGSFKVDDLEPGKYTLKVFFRGGWIYEKKINVEGRKQDVKVELKKISAQKGDDEDKGKEDGKKKDGEAKKKGGDDGYK